MAATHAVVREFYKTQHHSTRQANRERVLARTEMALANLNNHGMLTSLNCHHERTGTYAPAILPGPHTSLRVSEATGGVVAPQIGVLAYPSAHPSQPRQPR